MSLALFRFSFLNLRLFVGFVCIDSVATVHLMTSNQHLVLSPASYDLFNLDDRWDLGFRLFS